MITLDEHDVAPFDVSGSLREDDDELGRAIREKERIDRQYFAAQRNPELSAQVRGSANAAASTAGLPPVPPPPTLGPASALSAPPPPPTAAEQLTAPRPATIASSPSSPQQAGGVPPLNAGQGGPQPSTDPNAQTLTAADQAARLRGGPGVMGSQTGLGGPSYTPSPGRDTYRAELAEARSSDDRRDRWRRALAAVGMVLGARSANRGGGIGAAVPFLAASRGIAPSNAEERLGQDDERARELEALAYGRRNAEQTQSALQQHRRAQLLRQLRGDQASDDFRRDQLAQRGRLAQADDARADVEVAREAEERDFNSEASRQARAALVAEYQRQGLTPPPEIDKLAAVELRGMRDDVARGGRARTIAGGMGRGTDAQGRRLDSTGTPYAAGTAGVDEPSQALVWAQVLDLGLGAAGGTFRQPSEIAVRQARDRLARMSPEQRDRFEDSDRGRAARRMAGLQLPGFVSEGQVGDTAANRARRVYSQTRVATRALDRMTEIAEGASLGERGLALLGLHNTDAATAEFERLRFTVARSLRREGESSDADAQRLAAQVESLGSPSNLVGGSAGLRALRAQVAREGLDAIQGSGYRVIGGGNPLLVSGRRGRRGGGTPQGGDAQRGETVRVTVRNADGSVVRTGNVRRSDVDRMRETLSGGMTLEVAR